MTNYNDISVITGELIHNFEALNSNGQKLLLERSREMGHLTEWNCEESAIAGELEAKKRRIEAVSADRGEGMANYYKHIDPAKISYMGLESTDDDKPCLRVLHDDNDADDTFEKDEFLLTEGWRIYIANSFLRSLDLGVEISFENFPQYAELITACWNMLQERNGVDVELPPVDDSPAQYKLAVDYFMRYTKEVMTGWGEELNGVNFLLGAVQLFTGSKETMSTQQIKELDALISMVARMLGQLEESIDRRANAIG